MRCIYVRPLLAAYLHDSLGDGERQAVEAHLGGCRACAADLAELVRTERQVARGLNAWAGEGRPTLDLAAALAARLAPGTATPARPVRRRRWWQAIGAAAAAAAAALAMVVTFPSWAGAASELPLVGPWIQEILLRDAGLRWAFEHDLIQGTLARDAHDGIQLRVLGVLADPAQTTVIYEVTGLPPEPEQTQPERPAAVQADSMFWSAPARSYPSVHITAVDGAGTASSTPQPTRTPLGMVGTTHTFPLETEQATLTVAMEHEGKRWQVDVPVSRAPLGRYTREAPVGLAQTFGDVTVQVERVYYTPAQTIVEYTVDRAPFYGSITWHSHEWGPYLETPAGARHYEEGGALGGGGRPERAVFPRLDEPATFVIPGLVRGEAAQLEWPLAPGEQVQEYAGADVRLSRWERAGDRLAMEFSFSSAAGLWGFEAPVAVDAAGRTYETDGGEGASMHDGTGWRHYQWQLPAGADPVAVRVTRVGIMQEGPWRFPLPPG